MAQSLRFRQENVTFSSEEGVNCHIHCEMFKCLLTLKYNGLVLN